MKEATIAVLPELPREPTAAQVCDVDLVVEQWEDVDNVSVLYGRCQRCGALMTDGRVERQNLIFGLTAGIIAISRAFVPTTFRNDFSITSVLRDSDNFCPEVRIRFKVNGRWSVLGGI